MQKGMLSPWFMRRRLGLAIALPTVSLLGVVAPVSAIEARQEADKAVTVRPAVPSFQRSGFIASPTKSAIAEARDAVATQRLDMAQILPQPAPASEAPRPRQLMDLVSEATDAPTAEESVSEAVANDEASTAESTTDEADGATEADEATEAAPPVLSPPAESTSNADDADIPIPDERVLDDLQFLDPDPNPLLIQTQPEEVEIIGTQPLSLEEALALSYRNNPDLQVALLELEQREAALREAQAANFPTLSVNGNVQGQNTTSSGDTQLVPTPGGGFTFESETTEEIGYSYSAQLDLVYNVFSSGGRSASITAAAEQVQLALLEVERRREELRLATANEYYDLQAAIESIRISQAFLNEAERNLQDTSLREEVGVGTRFDVLRAEVQVANARQDLVNAERSRQVAQRALARRLNVPPSLTITTVPVDIAGDWPLSLEDSIVLGLSESRGTRAAAHPARCE
jgi:hypothetical protein